MFRDSYGHYNEEPCDRMWPSVTSNNLTGTHTKNHNSREKQSQKDDKIRRPLSYFYPSRLPVVRM